MMIDNTTALTQLIERVMLELVELNNQGVQLLGEGRLELARTAIYHATHRIQQVKDAQTQLESLMSRQYHHHHQQQQQQHRSHPLNLVLGVQGHCFVTPLELVSNNEGVAVMVDPMTSYEYGPVPQSTQAAAASSSAFVASTTSNEQETSHQARTVIPSSDEAVEQHATSPAPSQHEAVPIESISSSSTKTSSSLPSPSEDVQERKSPNFPTPQQQQQPLMMDFYAFLRPIFFSAQDFLHMVNPPLTHLNICLFFNLAVVNHKLAIRIMQQSSSSSSSSSLDEEILGNDDDDDHHRRRRQRMLVPLHEAIYLYKLAYRLQMENGMVEVSRLHTLGMLNNLGQLYYHAEMYAASKDCYQTLLEMITIHRVRDQGFWLRLNNATLFLGDSHNSGGESFWQRVQQQQLLLQQQEQQQEQDAPYMELFLDNIFQVLAHPQTSLNAPAA